MEQLTALTNFNSFTEMIKALPTDTACREYLEGIIWKGTPTCSHCGSTHYYRLKTKGMFKGQYKCGACKQRYNIQDNTMFEGTHIGLHKWFIAIYIFSLHKKGVSSHQLAEDLGITQKSAWFMLGRIRLAFKPTEKQPKMSGTIQADETYIGGKTRNMHQWKQDIINAAGTGAVHANAVFGTLNKGVVRVKHIANVNQLTITPILKKEIRKGATLVTDGHGSYLGLAGHVKHETVKHSEGEFVRNGFHTNGIENFWSQFKRGIYGIYHHCSGKHLHRYCDEFAFRYNVRKETVNVKFNFSLQNSKRLMYKTLIAD